MTSTGGRLRGGGDPDREGDEAREISAAYRLADEVHRRYWQHDTDEPRPVTGTAVTPNPPTTGDNGS